uniref:C2H2-type domain-containing protein n=1 Tax=Elaeophora elaphi TaxID=1147741 RepID=A0A0R3RHJ2_9BILA
MKEAITNGERIEKENEDHWLEDVSEHEIFLHAVDNEIWKKWTDDSIDNRELTTFLRSIYEKQTKLHPLSMHSLSLSRNFVLPRVIFIPPSQIVTLAAEYDADMTIQQLIRKLTRPGRIIEQKVIRYADNLLLTVAKQERPMNMMNILFELGRNIVADSFSIIGKDTGKVLANLTLLPTLECNLCNFKTESLIVLEAHKEIPHFTRRRYRCSYCPKFFVNFRGIKSHFLKKHDVIARSDCWKMTLECSFCAVVCSSEFNLKKHKKLCRFAKTGFTMIATKQQASCAISENAWNTATLCDLSCQKFKHSISKMQANQKEIGFTQKQNPQRWIEEDFYKL